MKPVIVQLFCLNVRQREVGMQCNVHLELTDIYPIHLKYCIVNNISESHYLLWILP